NLILLDGAPIYNASHIFGFLSVFNSNALGGASLVKGGFPARYGGRLSSVVDLSMKEGSRKDYAVDGTVGLVFSSVTAEGPMLDGRGAFIVSARRTYIDVLARPFMHNWLADGEELAAYFYDGSAKLSLQASGRSRLYYSLFLGRDAYGSTVESAAGDFIERNTSEADWGNVASTLRWNYLLSPKLFSSASLTFSRYRFDVLQRLTQISEEETSEQIAYSSGISDWTAALEFDYRPSHRHNLLFGGNLTRHDFNPGVTGLSLSGVDSTLTPDSFLFSGLEAYAFAEDELDIGSRLQANVGLHASAMHVRGVSYTSLQPRISARFLLGPLWSLRASYSTMRQYLQLLTNSGLNLPTDLWVAA
ncbi:MAG: TonB-dependent receptor, partial [Rhodothermales bacterium]